jgi:DNA-binding response OmpR family regulator
MRARILIVDDDQQYLDGVREWLDGAGYETSIASTFEAAKRAIDTLAPHLVLLDIRLGAFNGLQLMISTGKVRRIPAIVITGFDDPVLRADAAAFGARYLVKPVVPRVLLALIEELLAAEGSVASPVPPTAADTPAPLPLSTVKELRG